MAEEFGEQGWMTTPPFSLAANPFVVLPVSPRADAARIERVYADCLAARPAREPALAEARRRLLDPGDRLAAELGWLIDLEPAAAEPLLAAMAGSDAQALREVLATAPPLTKANVAADACARLMASEFVPLLEAAHLALDPQALTGLVNDARAAGGFPLVDVAGVTAALSELRQRHARAAVAAMEAAGEAPPVAAGTEPGLMTPTRVAKRAPPSRSTLAIWLVSGLVATAAIFALFIAMRSRHSPRPTAHAATPAVATVGRETLPPAASGVMLDRAQLRYCVFGRDRLDAVPPPTIGSLTYMRRADAANADFAARCGHVRYMSDDFAAVSGEATAALPRLRKEAQALARDWSR